MSQVIALEPKDSMLGHSGPWSEAEYLALADRAEGQRLELIDGELVVSPAGDWPHQRLGSRLYRELDRLASRAGMTCCTRRTCG